jgi:hypothetical protein
LTCKKMGSKVEGLKKMGSKVEGFKNRFYNEEGN